MIIRQLQVQHIQIPLALRFAQSNSSSSYSSSAIVRLQSQEGTWGYGESCPRPYVTGEDYASVQQDFEKLKPQLIGRRFDTMEAIRHLVMEELSDQVGLSTRCALELALLDAWSLEHQHNLYQLFAKRPKKALHYSGIFPLGKSDKILKQLQAFSFTDLKLKVGRDLEDTLRRIRQIRDAFGSEVRLRVDANCSWQIADAMTQIPILHAQGVYCFEQLFPVERDMDMQAVCRAFGEEVFLMADESITSLDRARFLIEHQLFNRFNIKLSKNGGLFNSLRLYELCQEYGLSCQLGAHFGETSILTAAGLLFAMAAPAVDTFEGALGTYLLEEDICSKVIQIDRGARIENVEEVLPIYGLSGEVALERLI